MHNQNYYHSIFLILKELNSNINLSSFIEKFNDECRSIGLSVKTALLTPPQKLPLKIISNKKYYWLLLIVIISIILVLGFILISRGEREISITSTSSIHNESMIHSALNIPTENVFLERSTIISKIHELLNNQKNIPAIALVGIGGSGKSTLARYYAHQQKMNVIWEINSETRDSIISSFESLAYELTKNEEEKKILRVIMNITKPKEREEHLIGFIKKKLNSRLNWLLIFDNVEKFADIQNYFPQDRSVWGKGTVIITTRDSNIANNIYLTKTIQVKELEEQEKFKLFTKIMHNNGNSLSVAIEQQAIKRFLKHIPSFPLDISIAAYYLKAIGGSYDNYLTHLNEGSNSFKHIQEDILKESNNYSKTRYSIITLSVDQLIRDSPELAGLLLFISLLDSQNIPRDLLSCYKGEIEVDNLIYNLNKYSLTIHQQVNTINKSSMISLHRSTQKICLDYLIIKLNLDKNRSLQYSVYEILDRYITTVIDKGDLPKMKLLVEHCKAFLRQGEFLDAIIKSAIEGRLGSMYLYLCDYKQSKKLLEKSIQTDTKNHIVNADSLEHLGKIYRELGDYEQSKNLLEKSLLIYRQNLNKNQAKIARTLSDLSIVYKNLGNLNKATILGEESLKIYYLHLPEHHLGIANSLMYLGDVYCKIGKYEKSKILIEQSLLICRRIFNSDSIVLARPLVFLSRAYRSLGEYKHAKGLLEESIKIYKYHYKESHIDIAWASAYLGNIHRLLGNYEQARNLLEDSLKICKHHYKKDHLSTVWISLYLGCVYRDLGKYKEAKILIEEGLINFKKLYGIDHINTAWILRNLGKTYLLEGNLPAAEKLVIQSFTILTKYQYPESYASLEILSQINLKKSIQAIQKGDMAQSKNFKDQAIDNLKEAIKVVKAHYPKNSPHIISLQNKLDCLK